MLSTALLLPSLALLASTSLAAGGPHSGTVPRRGRHAEKARKLAGAIGKRESNARMTYYDTSVGAGACGIVHQNDEWTVALNGDQLRSFGTGYPPPACGKQITISYGGKTATATVQDECPSQYCSWGQLDLSPGLFNFFATPDTGVINADWWFGGAGDGGSAPAPADPTTTTQAPPAETTTAAAPPPAETTSAAPVEATASAAAAPAETTSSAASVESSPAASVESSAAASSAPAEATTAAAVTSSAAVEFAAAPAATTSSAAAASESERVAEDDESLPWCDELPEEEQDPVTTTATPAATAAPIAAAAPAYTAPASGGGQGGGGEQAAPAQGTTVQAAAPAYTASAAAPAPVSGGSQTGGGGASTPEEGLEEGEEWCDEEPVDEAPAPLVASAVCPDAGSIVLVQNNTILYNNTLAAFTNFTRGLIAHDNSSLATSTNYTLPTNGTSSFLPINGTQLIQNTTALCYNSTLFQVANVSSWTNFTSLLFGNASAGADTNATRLLGLDGPINGAGGKNATLGFMGFLETLSQRRR